jgi:hypothetical protein
VVDAEDRPAVERDAVHEVEEPSLSASSVFPVVEVLGVDVGDDRDRRRDVRERAVRLVRLDDHVVALAELRVRAEGVHLPADHRRRIEPGVGEEVRGERGRRRLPVRAGDGDAVLEPHELGEHLGAGDDRDLAAARLDDLGVVLLHRGGGHDHVRLRDVAGGVTLLDPAAQRGEPARRLGTLEV